MRQKGLRGNRGGKEEEDKNRNRKKRASEEKIDAIYLEGDICLIVSFYWLELSHWWCCYVIQGDELSQTILPCQLFTWHLASWSSCHAQNCISGICDYTNSCTLWCNSIKLSSL